ncbi:cyclophilin-like fold protein [Campylobacter hyointestinalis]|uniref:cyclophilin-like fold protein n=1 Tax=Campylobacter hyointestinalis TaxID=198 RepID=UPI000DCB3CF3|nr:cyclophilin-like fold protein [Campylobacter hyointestinalis]RAZ22586.1 hypothetical protein CHL9752_08910 [Campylobacter hyointestinalis subsp. lawsonii]RAZ37336.1 hypothetical protein CHL9426_08980 [Campylobacter hyointestinalis subsp. lawsonii]
MQIFVSINEQKLKAILAENSSAKALYKELEKGDIIINASDYGGFEKNGKLPSPLPRNDEQITMQACDIILYSGQTFVLAYDINSWSLTRLGKIEGISKDELKKLLGAGSVEIRLSLK